jgi:hypothetical protein
MNATHIISPIGALGQHDDLHKFAYDNAGEPCVKLTQRWLDTKDSKWYGVRVLVQLRDGTTGEVWEDELDVLCDPRTCGGCWQCDPV